MDAGILRSTPPGDLADFRGSAVSVHSIALPPAERQALAIKFRPAEPQDKAGGRELTYQCRKLEARICRSEDRNCNICHWWPQTLPREVASCERAR